MKAFIISTAVIFLTASSSTSGKQENVMLPEGPADIDESVPRLMIVKQKETLPEQKVQKGDWKTQQRTFKSGKFF